MNGEIPSNGESTLRRLGLFGLFLLCGLVISLFPQLLQNETAALIAQAGITAGFLLIALWLRRKRTSQFFQVAFAFFTMSTCWLLLYALQFSGLFDLSTVTGYFVFQMVNASVIVVSVVLLTRISGTNLGEIYVKKGRLRIGLLVSSTIFVFFAIFIAMFPTGLAILFPVGGNMTSERVLSLMPWLIVFVLSNGFREEFWFRAIFLKRFEPFTGAGLSNVVTSLVFALSHVGVNYTPVLLVFLGIVLLLGLAFGSMMQKTDSVIAPAIFHAAMDIPAVLAIFSFLQ